MVRGDGLRLRLRGLGLKKPGAVPRVRRARPRGDFNQMGEVSRLRPLGLAETERVDADPPEAFPRQARLPKTP
jgi:hypothetical protein